MRFSAKKNSSISDSEIVAEVESIQTVESAIVCWHMSYKLHLQTHPQPTSQERDGKT